MKRKLNEIKVYSQLPLKSPFFLPFKNGLNLFLLYCSQVRLAYIKKIKGAAEKAATLTVCVNKTLRFISKIKHLDWRSLLKTYRQM